MLQSAGALEARRGKRHVVLMHESFMTLQTNAAPLTPAKRVPVLVQELGAGVGHGAGVVVHLGEMREGGNATGKEAQTSSLLKLQRAILLKTAMRPHALPGTPEIFRGSIPATHPHTHPP